MSTAELIQVAIPGLLAEFMAGTDWAEGNDDDPLFKDMRKAFNGGVRVYRGSGYSLRISASVEVIEAFCFDADSLLALGDGASLPERKAARKYLDRVVALGLNK